MIEGTPSRTAYAAAVVRALHQETESPLFVDPLAWRVVGDRVELLATAADWDQPGMSTFVPVRHRFADDSLAAAVRRGTRQLVVLGAGLDTLAHRQPPEVAVWEVDHPDTQAWKRSVARDLPGPPTYVPVDFETSSFLDELVVAGFDVDAPAFFVWLGVTPYLSRDAVRATLASIASVAGGEVVFEHATPMADPESAGHAERARLESEVAALGEPMVGSWDPDEMAAVLAGLGFTDVEVLDSRDMRTRYLGKPPGELRPGTLRLIRARVSG